MAAIPAKKILTVAQVNRLVAGMLQEYFADIWVVGEISNFKVHTSGHIYFVLKDENSQIQAVCFRDAARRLRFRPKDGDLVIAHGRLEVYVPNGRYQIILDTIEPKGLGALQRAFEELKRKLEKEGLFAQERKRPLPRLPGVVGIVTSPTGAAIHDMLRTLRLHRAHLKVLLYPVLVQGDGAAEEIARAIADLNSREDVDVIIVGRGGGSLEDLWPFNEEIVARAIAASRVPVVTGIGHEVDFTIADFVADVRAATPTAAAQMVAQGWEELERRLAELATQLCDGIQDYLFHRGQQIDELTRHRGFEQVGRRLAEVRHRVEVWQGKMVQVLFQQLGEWQRMCNSLMENLNRQNPVEKVLRWRRELDTIYARMEREMTRVKNSAAQRLAQTVARLDVLSPLASLSRGYAICQKPDGRVVKSIAEVDKGDGVYVRVADGRLGCRVEEKIKGGGGGK